MLIEGEQERGNMERDEGRKRKTGPRGRVIEREREGERDS